MIHTTEKDASFWAQKCCHCFLLSRSRTEVGEGSDSVTKIQVCQLESKPCSHSSSRAELQMGHSFERPDYLCRIPKQLDSGPGQGGLLDLLGLQHASTVVLPHKGEVAKPLRQYGVVTEAHRDRAKIIASGKGLAESPNLCPDSSQRKSKAAEHSLAQERGSCRLPEWKLPNFIKEEMARSCFRQGILSLLTLILISLILPNSSDIINTDCANFLTAEK